MSTSAFIFNFDHSRGSNQGDFAKGGATIGFSVDQAIEIELTGSYSSIDSAGRQVFFKVELRDLLGPVLFTNTQESRTTSNESFLLGQTGGDFENGLYGPTTGTLLLPGVNYLLEVEAFVDGLSGGSPALASGNVTLRFIPEPSTAVLLVFGLVVLTGRRRRFYE
jgi:hypothetical protein